MTYRILFDGETAYHQGDEDYAAYDVEIDTRMGGSGCLKATLPKTNPAWGRAVTRKTLVAAYLDAELLFEGEVREVSHDILGGEQVYAVGEMAWLQDSVQPQAEFHDMTSRAFLSTLLARHNEQCPEHQFRVGIVDVTDPNDSLYRFTNREQTLDCIRDKLVDRLGGYLRLRKANGVRYLDYVQEQTYGAECQQEVRFGENILDYSDGFTVDDVCSSVVPLGARLENDAVNSKIGNLEQRLTVESVNGGRDYVTDDALVARFGNVRTVHTWDDVTMPENLLAKARAWLKSDQYERMHVSVKAVDLTLTGQDASPLRAGDRAVVIAEPMGMRRVFPIAQRTFHPDDPASDVIEFGSDLKVSYAEQSARARKAEQARQEESRQAQGQWLADAIGNVTAMMTGDRGGYKLTEYDDQGRWLADYIMDSADKSTAVVVRKVNMNGTAYSTSGVDGPYDTAIMANGTILGKYIQAHSVTAEQISQDYTSSWEDADARTLNTARTEFKAADAQISAKVSQVEKTANGVKTDLAAEVRIRADQISQTVKRGQINSTIQQTAETIYIKSNKFGWESTNSSLSTNGTLRAYNATMTNVTASGSIECGNAPYAYAKLDAGSLSFQYNKKPTLVITSIPSYTDGSRGGQIYCPSGSTYLELRAPKLSTTTSTNPNAASQTTYTGSIYLTYGNGGTIYLKVVNGLILGWDV